MKTHTVAKAATLVGLLAALDSPALGAVRGEILDFGVSAGLRIEDGRADDRSNLSPAREMRRMRYLERTDRIEARLCRNFGISVRVSTDPPRRPARRVSVRVLHPEFVRPDGQRSVEDRFPSDVVDGVSHVGFTFEHEWEMKPGAWSMIVSAEGAEIARKDFWVTLPARGAPKSECGQS